MYRRVAIIFDANLFRFLFPHVWSISIVLDFFRAQIKSSVYLSKLIIIDKYICTHARMHIAHTYAHAIELSRVELSICLNWMEYRISILWLWWKCGNLYVTRMYVRITQCIKVKPWKKKSKTKNQRLTEFKIKLHRNATLY